MNIIKELCQWKGIEIIEGEMAVDHVHLLLSIPPKMSVSGVMGDLKGKSSLWDYIGYNVNNTYSIKITEAAFEACIEKGIKEATITIWGGDSINESSMWSTMPTLIKWKV